MRLKKGRTSPCWYLRIRRGLKSVARERGAAALEYILVSTFAAVITIAALVFIGHAVQEQLAMLGEKLGMDSSPEITLPFGDE